MQTLLTLAEHLRSSYETEVERVKQAQKQYDELNNRYDDMMKQWSNDKENIRQQRNEIGKRNAEKRAKTKKKYGNGLIRLCRQKFCEFFVDKFIHKPI